VFDALSYYSDNQAEINGQIERNRVPDELLHRPEYPTCRR
jgi:hypothetical protein